MSFYRVTPRLRQFFSTSNAIYLTQPLFNACFYGLKAIFVLYVIGHLSLSEGQAISLYATFMTLCYGTTLVGGYIADKGLGVKNTVTLGGILTALGLICIISFPSQDACFLGLALVSIGSGCFKSNLLTSVGLTFDDPKDPRKDNAYSIVYVIMNLGTLIVPTLCGFIGKAYGWHYGMILVTAIFMGATWLYHKTMRPDKENLTFFSSTLFFAFLSLIPFLYALLKYRESLQGLMGIIAIGSLVYLGKIFYQCNPEEKKGILSIIGYILLFALLAMIYEQSGSSMMLFYEKSVNRDVMGMVIPSAALLSLGSFFITTCSPLLMLLSNRYLEKDKPMNGFVKSGYGFLLAALGFFIFGWAISPHNSSLVSLTWVTLGILVQALGELWIVPVGLSKISQHSSSHLRGIMMSFWTMAIAYGHYFAGIIAQFSVSTATTSEGVLDHYQAFFFSLGLMLLGIGVLVLLYQMMKRRIFSGDVIT